MDQTLTAQEAADELGYNLDHLYKLLRTGRVEAKRFNRVWMIGRQEVERVKALQGSGGRLPKTARE